MKLNEYATHDGLGLAELVRKKKISAKELTITAATAIDKANPEINCVVETYPDRIEGLDERSLGKGPFHGVPFLIKDVFGHEKGRKIEFGSRLCKGMVADTDSNVAILLRKAGVNIIGRSSAPEYSMAGTSEGLLYGNASTPWKRAGLQAVRPGGPRLLLPQEWSRWRMVPISVVPYEFRRVTAVVSALSLLVCGSRLGRQWTRVASVIR